MVNHVENKIVIETIVESYVNGLDGNNVNDMVQLAVPYGLIIKEKS